ncbi:MAG: hypothetical protein ACUVX9_12705 [Anaerolineae bacterium]
MLCGQAARMARDVLFAIDELVAASQIIKKEDFLPDIWDLCVYKGKTLSMPFMEGFVPYGLVYNSKLAQEAGLDPTKPPVTWDQVYDWQVKLTQKDAAGNVTRMGLDPFAAMGQGIWFAGGFMAATSWGWKWFDESTRTFNFDNEKMVDAFATFKKLVDVVGIDNLMAVYATEGQDEWGGAYYAEIQSMLINGYWFPGEAMNNNPEVAKGTMATWLPVPESRRGTKVQSVYTSMLILFKQSKNPEVMYRIGEIMTLKPACDAVFNKTGWLPPIKTYLDTVDPSAYPGLAFYFDCVKEATEWHRPAVCEITRYASNKYAALREQVCRGELTPEEAAKLFQSDCTQEYINQGFAS